MNLYLVQRQQQMLQASSSEALAQALWRKCSEETDTENRTAAGPVVTQLSWASIGAPVCVTCLIVTKNLPKSNLREEGLASALCWRGQVITTGRRVLSCVFTWGGFHSTHRWVLPLVWLSSPCFCFVLFFSLGCQPMGWCCLHSGWVFPLQSNLSGGSQTGPELGFLRDYKSIQADNEDGASS